MHSRLHAHAQPPSCAASSACAKPPAHDVIPLTKKIGNAPLIRKAKVSNLNDQGVVRL